jgi:CheY-like chemotaxis protein
MTEAHLLLVHARSEVAASLAASLSDLGLRVTTASDATAAVAAFEDERPDLVAVSDLLPGEDGFSLCARLRLAALDERLPLILLSGRPDGRAQARAAGADACLGEPIDPTALATVARSLGIRRATPGRRPAPLPSFGGLAPPAGAAPHADPPALHQGVFDADGLPALLLMFHASRYTGPIEIRAGRRRVRLVLGDGHPESVLGEVPGARLGDIARDAGWLDGALLEAASDEAARRGVPLGRVLVQARLLDAGALEALLSEQTIRRILALRAWPDGRWRAGGESHLAAEAAYPVHVAVAVWRLAGPSVPLPLASDADLDRFVEATPVLASLWPRLDPQGERAGLRLMLLGGCRLGDAVDLSGPEALPLVALLQTTGVLSLADTPPDAAHRTALLARSDPAPFRERLRGTHAARCGADAWTALGLAPGSPPEAVERALRATLALARPDAQPAGLGREDRARAMDLARTSLAAARVLLSPRRRAVHERRLASPAPASPILGGPQDHAVLHVEHARRLGQSGHWLAAAGHYALALALEGEDPDLLALLGEARHRAAPQDPAAGEEALQRALALDPWNEAALAALAGLLADRGEAGPARDLLGTALLTRPDLEGLRPLMAALAAQDPPPGWKDRRPGARRWGG